MYSSVRYSVKLEDGTTPFFNSFIGVKQGCNLSPTLFNIFLNDVPNLFDDSCDPVRLGNTNLNCLLYADDLVLLSESQKGLQSCLTKLEKYTNRRKLNINNVTDNGSQFTSSEFQKFLGDNDIHHTTTAPGHPATNELTERYVGDFKDKLSKMGETGESLQTKLDRLFLSHIIN